MLQSQLFTKVLREAPKDEQSQNAKLLVRAGFIHKEMAGVYAFLPLGLRVLEKIKQIIKEEMDELGGEQVLLTSLQDPQVWKKSGRWDDKVVDNWFKTKFVNGADAGIANTHEEPLTNLMKEYVSSWRDLPCYVYQFQTKFRNELRAKSGLMRVREFLMKDLYSFSRTEEEFKDFYEKCAAAYLKIFSRVGLKDYTFRTFASGGSFSEFSDEFQAISEAGEDIIYIDRKKNVAVNKEVYKDDVLAKLGLKKAELEERKAIEIGNIFPLGTKYSSVLGLAFKDKDGQNKPVVMGSYGIGLGRLMGTIAEIFHDEKGIIWPKEVAPFQIHLIRLGLDPAVQKAARKIYQDLQKNGQEVLFDEREGQSAGEKFAEADLLGIPLRLVISQRTLENETVEVKKRSEEKAELVPLSKLNKIIS
jgi:prolyl-tRNA synthetase